jgi:hypothetical protein
VSREGRAVNAAADIEFAGGADGDRVHVYRPS